jgi:hypothetical protein
MYNRLDELKELVIADPRAITMKSSDGWTVAHWAAQRGYEDMLSFIADRAPSLLTTQCKNGSVPAHYAATYGHNNIITLLGDRDPASLMVQDNSGDTPAHDATANNKLFTLKLLVQSCPSLIYGANNKGERPIDLAQRDEIHQFLKVPPTPTSCPSMCLSASCTHKRIFMLVQSLPYVDCSTQHFFAPLLLRQDAEKASMVPAVQMQNLQKESKVLNAMTAVLALYCKHYWETEGDNPRRIFSKVPKDAQEFKLVTNEFGRTMSRAVVSV